MRSAVCLSGRPYGLLECADSIKKCLIEPNNADVFIHAWHNPELEGTRYRSHPQFPGLVPKDAQKKLLDIYQPKNYIIEPQKEFSIDGIDSVYQPGDKYFVWAIQSMLYSIKECINLALDWNKDGDPYDAICRSRMDLFYRTPVEFDKLDLNKLNLYDDAKHEPGACNDHFAVGDSRVMRTYADVYPEMYKMYAYGTPWCNEVFLGRWMRWNKIEKQHVPIQYFQWK
jgi:hypothetical protein